MLVEVKNVLEMEVLELQEFMLTSYPACAEYPQANNLLYGEGIFGNVKCLLLTLHHLDATREIICL